MEKKMNTGTVKWFNHEKAFGFITPDAGGDDVLADYDPKKEQNFIPIKEGQRVSYTLLQTPEGAYAVNTRPL